MSCDDVSAELSYAKQCIEAGLYMAAVEAIDEAIKAWQIELDSWAIELTAAEREINGRCSHYE